MALWKISVDRGDVLVAEADLWLDPAKVRSRAYVSHAHFDHIGKHNRVICTRETATLMEARLKSKGKRFYQILTYGERASLDDGIEISLYPAGHIPGSSQILIRREGRSVLYTGDFKLEASPVCEPFQFVEADVLIMETTFGKPRYIFPPRQEVISKIVAFCSDALRGEAVPVLLGYSLGKGQELIHILNQAGLPVMLHPTIAKMTETVRPFCSLPLDYKPLDLESSGGHVIILPQMARGLESAGKQFRTAAVTGWALDSSTVYRYQCDAAFPLSDHAGYDELLRLVEAVKPKEIYTVHGYAKEFAADLRARGYEAWALGRENQLEFSLETDWKK